MNMKKFLFLIQATTDVLKKLKSRKYNNATWINNDLRKLSSFPKPNYSQGKNLSATDLFLMLFF